MLMLSGRDRRFDTGSNLPQLALIRLAVHDEEKYGQHQDNALQTDKQEKMCSMGKQTVETSGKGWKGKTGSLPGQQEMMGGANKEIAYASQHNDEASKPTFLFRLHSSSSPLGSKKSSGSLT
ncbi:hypothetical protein XYCOK13_11740 [Xylanibacillus composti]|uniref:Uncharacterized protein n=1 Tax=Xylanibacillus composti TaxID=1572762 RepID=A0A8J4H2D3_9BACL|nr:hypothetical protein XYCOK13_11740 [Xylanibacillus composti]